MGSDTQRRFFELAKQAEKARQAGVPEVPDVPEELRLQPSERDQQPQKRTGLPCLIGAMLTMGAAVLLLGAAGIGGWLFYTHMTFQKPMDEIMADAANRGFKFNVKPDPMLENLSVDLTEWPDDARKHELIRVLLQYAGKIKAAKVQAVILCCLGRPRFKLDGGYFHELGQSVGVDSDIKLIRTFPEHVGDLNGAPIYPHIEAQSLEDAALQLSNFSKLIDAWTAP